MERALQRERSEAYWVGASCWGKGRWEPSGNEEEEEEKLGKTDPRKGRKREKKGRMEAEQVTTTVDVYRYFSDCIV